MLYRPYSVPSKIKTKYFIEGGKSAQKRPYENLSRELRKGLAETAHMTAICKIPSVIILISGKYKSASCSHSRHATVWNFYPLYIGLDIGFEQPFVPQREAYIFVGDFRSSQAELCHTANKSKL